MPAAVPLAQLLTVRAAAASPEEEAADGAKAGPPSAATLCFAVSRIGECLRASYARVWSAIAAGRRYLCASYKRPAFLLHLRH